MAERRSPLAGRLPWSSPDGAVTLSELPFPAQIALRLRPADAPAAGMTLPLPLPANTVAVEGARRTLWLGPDEWLITAPDGAAAGLMAALGRALAGRHAALVDVSASRAVIALGGAGARDLLAKGCGLDLHPRAFAAGRCAQTMLARAPIILDQTGDEPAYRLFVRRSLARYLADWLIDASGEEHLRS